MVRRGGITSKLRRASRRIGTVLVVCLLFCGTTVTYLPRAYAEQLSSRTLRIENPASGATTRHTFTFSYGAASPAVGSVAFEYCTSPLAEIPCDAPPGMDAAGAVLAGQTGEIGFSIVGTQTNKIILGRAAATVPTNNPSSYVFDTIVNPGGAPGHFFVRIATYASSDGTGTAIDFGAVASSTTQGVHISTEVPPILKFCVGLTLADDCTAADESVVDLGDLSTAQAASGASQMIAATNAEFGLAIAVYGTTMTSGNNVIPALASPTVSAPGNAQFGMNLRDNSNPNIGQDPTGPGLTAPTTNYNIPNRYAFESGSVVATSPAATDTRKFTSSYVVNVSPSQPPGVYTATLTYICTATF